MRVRAGDWFASRALGAGRQMLACNKTQANTHTMILGTERNKGFD